MAYIGKTGRKLANRFREHLMFMLNETAKPDSFNLSSSDHPGEDISDTALKSFSSYQGEHTQSYGKSPHL